MAQGFTKSQPLDTDPTLAGDSDYIAPSQSAVKAYVDAQVGSSSGYAAEVEVDFGDDPYTTEATFTVADVNISATSDIIAQIKYKAPTDKDLDEVTMDNFDIIITPASGQFEMRMASMTGSVYGKFRVTYLVL